MDIGVRWFVTHDLPFLPLEDQPLVMSNVHTSSQFSLSPKKPFKIYFKPSIWKSIPMWIGLLDSYHNYLHGKKMHVLHVADFPASKNLDLMEECMAV